MNNLEVSLTELAGFPATFCVVLVCAVSAVSADSLYTGAWDSLSWTP